MTFCVGCATCAISLSCPKATRASGVSRDAQKWLGYIGTTLFMLGALAIAVSPAWSAQPLPFVAFLIGHIVWGGLGYLIQERPLFAMNALYLVFDVWAILTRL